MCFTFCSITTFQLQTDKMPLKLLQPSFLEYSKVMELSYNAAV